MRPRSPILLPLFARIVLLLAWAFLVLYPQPWMLADSIENYRARAVDPVAVEALARQMPDDPAAIERLVLDRIVPYGYDWEVSGVPWYFPTTREALAAGRGDCESRAMVLASLLDAKGIPYQLRLSLDHIWVDYPGKQPTAIENEAVAIAEERDGRFIFNWPADFDPWEEFVDQVAILWEPMPLPRKLLLFAGCLLALAWNALARGYGVRMGLLSPPDLRPERRRRLRRDVPRRLVPGARPG